MLGYGGEGSVVGALVGAWGHPGTYAPPRERFWFRFRTRARLRFRAWLWLWLWTRQSGAGCPLNRCL